jgi:hypothetical protein
MDFGVLSDPATGRTVQSRTAQLLGLDPTLRHRGSLLPVGVDANGEAVAAWPEWSVGPAQALMTPGHVAGGGDWSPRDATDMALAVAGGGGAGVGAFGKAAKSLEVSDFGRASVIKNLYNLPTKSEVGHAELARSGTGQLDLEGRPLVARYVAGRPGQGVLDQSIPEAAYAEMVERQTGRPPSLRARSSPQLRGALGAVSFHQGTRRPLGVAIDQSLSEAQAGRVLAHEVGHVLDEVAGQIPIKGLSKELKALYHYGIEGKHRSTKQTLPTHLGYRGEDVNREYMAEALRQYMAAPDTFKDIAPETAKRIRAAINDNPNLRDMIQFNTGAAPLSAPVAGLPGFGREHQR